MDFGDHAFQLRRRADHQAHDKIPAHFGVRMAQTKNPVHTLVDSPVHVLYCGVTMTGKTTLARHHARILARAGYDVAVYDPVGTETAGGDWEVEGAPAQPIMFHDDAKFMHWLERARGEPERPIFVFVDEAADIFGHGNNENQWLPRRVRHQNIYLRLLSQRPKMLPPNVRTQCALCYMFRLSVDDARVVCADFGHGTEVAQKTLDTGDFIVLTSGASAIDQANVFELVRS